MPKPGDRMISRRVFAGLALLMLAPRVAFSQSRDVRRLGVLLVERLDDPTAQARPTALSKGLAALGWREGTNLRIDWRFAGGDPALFERYAAELVALNPEVIVTGGTPAVTALRRHTHTIPIVFSTLADPVGQGFVESLARPGGIMTGFTDTDPVMTGKRLGMLKQIAPPVAHVAVLYNPATAPGVGPTMQVIEQMAPTLDVTVRAAGPGRCGNRGGHNCDLARTTRRSARAPRRFYQCTPGHHRRFGSPIPASSGLLEPFLRHGRRINDIWRRLS